MTEPPIIARLDRWEVVACRWKLDDAERAALLGVGPGGAVADIASYCSPSTERRLALLVSLDRSLTSFFGDDVRILAWLRRKNAGLGGRLPLEVMAQSPEWIRWLVDVMATAS